MQHIVSRNFNALCTIMLCLSLLKLSLAFLSCVNNILSLCHFLSLLSKYKIVSVSVTGYCCDVLVTDNIVVMICLLSV